VGPRVLLLIVPALAAAQQLEPMARAYMRNPTVAARAPLLAYAAVHESSDTGALTLLAAGAGDLAAKRYSDALPRLETAAKRLSSISDHAAFLAGKAAFELNDDGKTLRLLEPVWKSEPESPLTGRAALLAARSLERASEPRKAVELLQKHYAWLPQPAGDLGLAMAFEAAGDALGAVPTYQRVYYNYPLADEAREAGRALDRLRLSLAERFPPAMPSIMVGRALKLLEGREYRDARREFEDLAGRLGGAERDEARLRAAVANYYLRETKPALEQLKAIETTAVELDAERQYWILQCDRRLDDEVGIRSVLDTLAAKHAQSRWRVESLAAAGNYYAGDNKPQEYEPLFRACYELFPRDNLAAHCHWRVAFSRYMRRDGGAPDSLREHLRLYPQSDKAPAALYFLGRSAEDSNDPGASRAWYAAILNVFPNTYYSTLASQRLSAMRGGSEATGVNAFLRGIAFPAKVKPADFKPEADTRRRLKRAQTLSSAGLDHEAEIELLFGARNGNQPQVYALELAKSADRRSAPEQGIRYIKGHAPGYLLYPLKDVPGEFWNLAFPLPYRDALLRYSKANSLDPYMVAALIRQESEFDARAVSHANAYGLTQILPSTGRELARRTLRARRFPATALFQPEVNIQLGTAFLRSLLTSFDNRWEPALAAYNAGRTRAALWFGWQNYRDPAEYVETIPVAETRNYVQLVIRNAAIYRSLYDLGAR
jgi:soluble lytic murein transglycosylase